MPLAHVRVALKYQGIRRIGRGPEMYREMLRRAEKVKAAAEAIAPPDQDLYATGFYGLNRARASVMAPGGERSEHAERYLGKSLDAARG